MSQWHQSYHDLAERSAISIIWNPEKINGRNHLEQTNPWLQDSDRAGLSRNDLPRKCVSQSFLQVSVGYTVSSSLISFTVISCAGILNHIDGEKGRKRVSHEDN